MLGGRTQRSFMSPPFTDWALARIEAPAPHTLTFFLARGTHKGTCAGPVTIDLPVTTTGKQRLFGQALRVAIGGAASATVDFETGPARS
jgi:hypothetical protein